jgi:hypothetical protein
MRTCRQGAELGSVPEDEREGQRTVDAGEHLDFGDLLLQSLNAAIDPRAAHSNTTATSPTRARLGEEAFANAWQQERMLTLEQAVDEAMSKGS